MIRQLVEYGVYILLRKFSPYNKVLLLLYPGQDGNHTFDTRASYVLVDFNCTQPANPQQLVGVEKTMKDEGGPQCSHGHGRSTRPLP